MNILITGAGGFIGSHIAHTLAKSGHMVTGCVRRKPATGSGNIRYIICDFAADTKPESWQARLEGIDIVINVVGIITESGPNTFKRVHVEATQALFDACKEACIKHVIHISALGVCETAKTAYNITKLAADTYLQNLKIPYTILRPSWLYGQRSPSFEVLCAFAALPLIPVVDKGQYKVQPLWVTDFATGVSALVKQGPQNTILDVGGPEQFPIKEVLSQFRHWLGLRKAPILPVPASLTRHIVKLGDVLFKGPINSASFDMLTRHNITESVLFWQKTGIQPQTLPQTLAQNPVQRSDTFYARLFFVLPLLRYSLAFMWIASALIPALFIPKSVLLDLFAEVHITGRIADITLWGALGVDFILGVALLSGRYVRLTCMLQMGIIALYTVALSLFAPHWWLHPYGPVLKNIPILIATWAVLAAGRAKHV